MLPVANLHLKDLYETTVEFFTLRSPAFSYRSVPNDDPDSEPPTPSDISPASDPVATRQNESANLRVKRTAAKRARGPTACSCRSFTSAAASTLYTMRREHDRTKSELARSQADSASLEEKCKSLEKTLKETKDLLRARDLEIEALKQDKAKLIADRRSLSRPPSSLDRRRSHDVIHHRSNSSQSLSQRIRLGPELAEHRDGDAASQAGSSRHRASSDAVRDNISTISEEERAHTRSMEVFLTKTDLWSGAQVIQAVQDLNSEILQFAASAVEVCTFTKQRTSHSKIGQTVNDVTTRLGPSLSRMLSTHDHSQDPMLVQLALQGSIAFCISRALSSFCIGYQSKGNITLTQIYTRMFQSEPQPMSSRWRALTHKHIHELHPELSNYAVNEMTDTILRWTLDVFLICGCTNPQPNPTSREAFRTRFQSQVKRISKNACALAQISREEIMSANFEVVGAESGRAFDTQEMVDVFEDYGASKGAVLCTTELGLRCSTRKATTETAAIPEENIERRLLLRPKVVLDSAMDVIDQR
ncbi:hypothetical protein F5J12DRAFT_505697 [Pisolithus orientalis]|uniref:uncharacterized protein n=1 Tax=Pisolithus orientalis TaxID=936130 RepID=UPI002224EFA2|nr:uncharacterized protein F5J12DRAFT_505697 [Pisolithus orientalis]KAI5989426.1 hypothetical protein F5J12DRAFT_505697 [Pisolithus orientalis]